MIYIEAYLLLTLAFTIVGVTGYFLLGSSENTHRLLLGILAQVVVCCLCLMYHMTGIVVVL